MRLTITRFSSLWLSLYMTWWLLSSSGSFSLPTGSKSRSSSDLERAWRLIADGKLPPSVHTLCLAWGNIAPEAVEVGWTMRNRKRLGVRQRGRERSHIPVEAFRGCQSSIRNGCARSRQSMVWTRRICEGEEDGGSGRGPESCIPYKQPRFQRSLRRTRDGYWYILTLVQVVLSDRRSIEWSGFASPFRFEPRKVREF